MDVRTLLIADEGFISNLKEKFAKRKAEKKDIARIKEELKAMEPKEAATKILRAMLTHTTSDSGTILKEDPYNELEELCKDCRESPGMIHPQIPYLIKIDGYPLLLITTKNKQTKKEEFSSLFFNVDLPSQIGQKLGLDSVQSDIVTLHTAAMFMSVNKLM